jgi:hypothetical protein
MLEYATYRYGNILGTQYLFPNRGDGLPMHYHNIEDRHNVICLVGSCEIYGPEKKWSAVLKPGNIYHFDEEQYPHEIVALEPNTMILNLCMWGNKFDFLKNYGEMGESGELDTPVTIPLPDIKPTKKTANRRKS